MKYEELTISEKEAMLYSKTRFEDYDKNIIKLGGMDMTITKQPPLQKLCRITAELVDEIYKIELAKQNIFLFIPEKDTEFYVRSPHVGFLKSYAHYVSGGCYVSSRMMEIMMELQTIQPDCDRPKLCRILQSVMEDTTDALITMYKDGVPIDVDIYYFLAERLLAHLVIYVQTGCLFVPDDRKDEIYGIMTKEEMKKQLKDFMFECCIRKDGTFHLFHEGTKEFHADMNEDEASEYIRISAKVYDKMIASKYLERKGVRLKQKSIRLICSIKDPVLKTNEDIIYLKMHLEGSIEKLQQTLQNHIGERYYALIAVTDLLITLIHAREEVRKAK